VLLVTTPQAGFTYFTADVQNLLVATGAFSRVDVVNAGVGTPSVAQLQAYDAVLVFSDYFFQNPGAMGTNLANYRDAGGRVVVAVFATAIVPFHCRADGRPMVTS